MHNCYTESGCFHLFSFAKLIVSFHHKRKSSIENTGNKAKHYFLDR